MQAHLRVARPTNDLSALLPFYREGLGFLVVGEFHDHAGFDGVMLGHPDWPYHLEFTRQQGHRVGPAPSQEHLLVFYLPDETRWRQAVSQMERCGYRAVPSLNPYWDTHGKTFEDPDGYRVVLQNDAWENLQG